MGCQKILKSILLVIGSVFLFCSCQNVSQVSEVYVKDLENDVVEEDRMFFSEISNPYFCIKGNDKIDFKGVAWFLTFGDIPIPKYKPQIHFIEITKLKRGILYQLKIDQMPDNEIPKERLSLGYFYVQKDKIIRIWENADYEAESNVWEISQEALKDLENNDIIPKYSAVVC